MATILLMVIYIAFIGLGIPDSLFGTGNLRRMGATDFVWQLCHGDRVLRHGRVQPA